MAVFPFFFLRWQLGREHLIQDMHAEILSFFFGLLVIDKGTGFGRDV